MYFARNPINCYRAHLTSKDYKRLSQKAKEILKATVWAKNNSSKNNFIHNLIGDLINRNILNNSAIRSLDISVFKNFDAIIFT